MPTAEYMREYRKRRPEWYQRERAKQDARSAAALRVAKRYPTEFAAAIINEERKRGIR